MRPVELALRKQDFRRATPPKRGGYQKRVACIGSTPIKRALVIPAAMDFKTELHGASSGAVLETTVALPAIETDSTPLLVSRQMKGSKNSTSRSSLQGI